MSYAFRYVPTSGDLSGEAFEKQTETAINELGRYIGDSTAGAEEAKSLAENAVATANSAQDSAQQAVTIAQQAETTATAAAARAEAARQTAQAAESGLSATAEVLGQAVSTAGNAMALAEAAETAASAAQDAVAAVNRDMTNLTGIVYANADAVSQSRMFTATDTDGNPFDCNKYYFNHAKIHLTGDGVSNGPPNAATPLWVEVSVTNDGLCVLQHCLSGATDTIFTRYGSIDSGDPDKPVVTWGPWRCIADTEAILRSAKTYTDTAIAESLGSLSTILDAINGEVV